jgi:A/G-specific adenine glycosylase
MASTLAVAGPPWQPFRSMSRHGSPTAGSSPVPGLQGRHSRLQRLLLAWYRTDARHLPWRGAGDPYRVLVSEVMLQQTQAARVQPIYEAFIARFPTVADLAAAPVGDVVTHWRGLGYNRRATSLHRAAVAIVERHGGRVPDDFAALRALAGVGEYTARAVLAFAFGRQVAPVDVNVARVLSRAASGRPQTRREVQELADAMVPTGEASAWGQALMDLGARYCTTRTPRCDACPVAAACAWRLAVADNGQKAAEDPAGATALRARPQGPFVGSNRFHRGRLVEALRRGPVPADDLSDAAGLVDGPRLAALTRALVDEGLAEWAGGSLRLPD